MVGDELYAWWEMLVVKRGGHNKQAVRETAELAVVENAKWVDHVLWGQVAVGLAVIIAKLMGVKEFEWQQVKLNVSSAWFVFVLLTIAHLYACLLLIKSIRRVWDVSDNQARRALFERITASGGLFVRGLVARTECEDNHVLFVRYRMSPTDPSAWAALIAVLLLFIAIIPFSLSASLFWMALLALAITQANWQIGSHWVIALSDLTNDYSSAVYFRHLKGGGLRVIGITSGGYAFERVSVFALPLWFLLNSFLFLSTPLALTLMWIFRFSDWVKSKLKGS